MIEHQTQKNKGFTLLFSVLVSILVLAVGASMINIALKQVVLSTSGRESQFAFYAANTGIECALYWDVNVEVDINNNVFYTFPYDDGTTQQEFRTDFTDVTCAGGDIEDGAGFGGSNFITTTGAYDMNNVVDNSYKFRMEVTNTTSAVSDIEYCAEVIVEKESAPSNAIKTTITSRGFNSCDPDNDPRAVERAIVIEYTS